MSAWLLGPFATPATVMAVRGCAGALATDKNRAFHLAVVQEHSFLPHDQCVVTYSLVCNSGIIPPIKVWHNYGYAGIKILVFHNA